jgi:hypothetical protein
MAYYYKVQIQKDHLRERLVLNAQSGIQSLLASKLTLDSAMTTDLYGNGKDSVFIRTTCWGLFEVGYVRAFSHRDSVSRTIMLGTVADSIWSAALYLVDQGRPVTLAGSTLLKGTVYLPEAGPKRGWIEGSNFANEKLVQGQVKKSSNQLPPLDKAFLKQLLRQVDPHPKGTYLTEKEMQVDSIVAPFDRPSLRIHSKGRPLEIGNITLKGNIIISSDTLILVSSSAKLHHVLLSAPVIKFKEGFTGNLQAFATDSIVAGEDCHFTYPSSLSLLEIDSSENRPKILLAKKCTLEGVALVYVTFIDRSLATFFINKGAEVEGQIYADGQTSLEGGVYGTLVCNKLLLIRPSGIYENHLLDCSIDRTKLSPHFLGSPLFTNTKKGIVSWLD